MITSKFFCAALLLFVFAAGNAQTTASAKKSTATGASANSLASFNGAWRSDDNKSFNVMHDGYFNVVSQDSTGKWQDVHAGTYTVDNSNTATFKILYSSYPDHVGSANTVEYNLNGNTMKVRHFKKLVDAQGKDVTDQMPKDVWETMVRAQ